MGGSPPPATYKVSRPLQQIGIRILSFQTGSHFLQLGSKLNKIKRKTMQLKTEVIVSIKLLMHCSWCVVYSIKALEGKVCKSRSCCPQFHPQLPASLQPGTKLARTPPPPYPPTPPTSPQPPPPPGLPVPPASPIVWKRHHLREIAAMHTTLFLRPDLLHLLLSHI